MRGIAATSPASPLECQGRSPRPQTVATSASPADPPGGRSHHSRSRLDGRAAPAGRQSSDLEVHLHRPVSRQGLEQLADGGMRSRPGQEEGGVAVDGVTAARTGDRHRAAVSAASAHWDATPPPWMTISTSSSRASGSKRRGMKVRIVGRRPSGRRNSLPFQLGTNTSGVPGGGSSSRTLAAGCSTVKPSRSGPANVTRSIRGLKRSTRHTAIRQTAVVHAGRARRRGPLRPAHGDQRPISRLDPQAARSIAAHPVAETSTGHGGLEHGVPRRPTRRARR